MNQPSTEKLSPREIRNLITSKEIEGLKPIIGLIHDQSEAMLRGMPNADQVMDAVHNVTNTIQSVRPGKPTDLARCRTRAMARYLLEARDYKDDATAQYRFLSRNGLLVPGSRLIDLGSGPGALVNQWANQGEAAIGVDLSPAFVARVPQLRLGLIDEGPDYLKDLLKIPESDDKPLTVTSNLTTDRTGDPEELIHGLTKLAGPKGNFVLGTLVPIVPYDDEPESDIGEHPITYTPRSLRLAEGQSAHETIQTIKELLNRYSGKDIVYKQVAQRVETGAEKAQEYSNYYVFHNQVKR